MKTNFQKTTAILFGLVFLSVSAAYAQQTFTRTVTAKTIRCNSGYSVTDVPKLNNNSDRSARLDAKSPGAVIKNFYFWYINAVEAGTDPFKKGRAMLQKYVTLRLIKQIERSETDADTFLQTQDWDKAWADNADVSNGRVNGATATAIVTFDAETNYPRFGHALRPPNRKAPVRSNEENGSRQTRKGG
ncbi:MAG TPA: hypothetical protein VGQ55_00685 [Pyrinomonadaceae bacterium]|nr:hypothetical protein [Pyrinomonadaceae bacterium]